MTNVLLGVTDHESVSGALLALVDGLKAVGPVKIVVTKGSQRFVTEEVPGALVDEHEWHQWNKVGDEIQHIELTRWADCLLVAPCSAHYLGKLAHGLCDDLLSCAVRAWPPEQPILLVPVMHPNMWQHKVTSKHLEILNGQANLKFLLAAGATVDEATTQEECSSALPSPERLKAAVKQLQVVPLISNAVLEAASDR